MTCPWCKTEGPDLAPACRSCGRSFRSVGSGFQSTRQYAYKDLVVNLNLDARIFPNQVAVRDHCNRVISLGLRNARQDGWEPAGAADWDELWSAGRVKVKSGVYEYVNVELRRPRPR